MPVGNSASILRANNPRKNLSRVLELYMETVNPSQLAGKGGKPSKSLSSSKTPTKGGVTTWKSYLVGKKPIIVVPKGMTAPITIVNAHEFLCHGRYVSRSAMLQQLSQNQSISAGAAKHPPTTFTRTVPTVDSTTGMISSSNSDGGHSTGLLEYEIIDNPCKLGNNPKEWERIVAVIVLGQSWQFKDWMKGPISYNVPASLFDRVFGYYIYMEGDQIAPEVQQWAVKKSQLNRDKRGLDSVSYASFWNQLDEWMKVYKAELLPQTG
jgi:parafibromin